MEDKLEKKLKAFLPYIIIIGVIYLLVPALLLTNPNRYLIFGIASMPWPMCDAEPALTPFGP